jgi:phage shock protein PspC (stress-responsive transcriptional regulator)
MNKVIIINLNGIAYQIDEEGYEKLKAYLSTAEAQLANNPDRLEIIKDLEQAVADKCHKYISAQKNVVSVSEVEQIILEMGPVAGENVQSADEAAAAGPRPEAPKAHTAPKRLYQIQQGAWISGLCNGIAAYFNIDVRIVRVLFVVFALATKGFGVLVYLGLALWIPCATTSEEEAEAHGQPFNAQELIKRAGKNYENFRNSSEFNYWSGQWRRQHANMRQQWRQQRRQWRRQWRNDWRFQNQMSRNMNAAGVAPSPALIMARPLFGLAQFAITVIFFMALISLITSGTVFGMYFPVVYPMWVNLIGLFIIFKLVTSPFAFARRAAYSGGFTLWHVWGGLLEVALVIFVGWWAYNNVPQVQEALARVPEVIQTISDYLRSL